MGTVTTRVHTILKPLQVVAFGVFGEASRDLETMLREAARAKYPPEEEQDGPLSVKARQTAFMRVWRDRISVVRWRAYARMRFKGLVKACPEYNFTQQQQQALRYHHNASTSSTLLESHYLDQVRKRISIADLV